jgi:hypothetical protein
METRPGDLTRRDVLKAAATVAAVVPLATGEGLVSVVAAATNAPLFFTRDQFALVDELCELIIPADEHSGGARAAGVAAYIDKRIADAFDQEPKQQWTDGLAAIDQLARDQKGARFMDLTPADREALLTAIAAEEEKPTTPAGQFFVRLKRQTVRGYYTSKIGIHDELDYKGNVLQQEYTGTDVSTS